MRSGDRRYQGEAKRRTADCSAGLAEHSRQLRADVRINSSSMCCLFIQLHVHLISRAIRVTKAAAEIDILDHNPHHPVRVPATATVGFLCSSWLALPTRFIESYPDVSKHRAFPFVAMFFHLSFNGSDNFRVSAMLRAQYDRLICRSNVSAPGFFRFFLT
jgi:hypothetical protein